MKLFLLNPEPAFKARVNNPGSFVFPIQELEYDTVTLGTFSSIWPNMTVFIGSTDGASDLGVTRVRALPDSNTLPIGLSSQGNRYGEIDPTDNAYITVLHDYRVFAKIPRIDSDGTRYMDGALDWATYGEFSPPIANAGPAFAGTIDSGTGKITVTFSAAASFTTHPGATIASYAWAVHDGTITVGTSSSSTITATFDAGFRWVTLGIIDSNSQAHYTHVPVLAIDPDDDPCISNFTIERHTIGIEGQELTVRVRESIPASTYYDNTLCLLIDGDPANATDRANILLTGWCEQESAEIEAGPTATLKDITLNLVDVAGRLKSLPGFSQVLENVASPSKWGEMASPNMDRFLAFLMTWQSTALDLADFTWSGTTTTYPFKILSSEGASLWEQVARKAQALVPEYRLTCNTRGQLRVIVDPMLQPTADRTSTVQVTLDAGDYADLRYTQQRHPRTHWLRSNAIIANASSVSAVFAIAPGEAPGFGEGEQTDGENLAVSQAALNAYAGHKYARLNAPQGLFTLVLAEGSTQGIQPADLTWVRLTLPSSVAAQRGLTLTSERGLVHDIDVRYQSSRTALLRTVTLRWERESSGTSAVTVTVPAADPVDTGDWNVPPAAEPAFDYGLDGGEVLAAISGNGTIYTTSNFLSATPTWSANSSAASAVSITKLHGFVVDPFSPGYRGTGTEIRGYAISNVGVWRINDIFGTPSYTNLFNFGQNISGAGESGAIAASFGRFFPDEADNPWIMAVQSRFTGTTGDNGVYLAYSQDAGATWSSEIRPSTFTQTVGSGAGIMRPAVYLSPKTPGLAYIGSFSASGSPPTGAMYRSTDWGATWSLVTDLDIDQGDGLGHCYHVPWPSNAGEDLVYYGYRDRNSSQLHYRLYRTQGGVSTDISPLDSGIYYGPLRNGFGVRTHDNDRRYVLLAGIANDSDNVEPATSGTDAKAAVFFSDDYGDTWTRLTTAVAAGTNTNFAYQCAFGASTPDIMYIWGNDAYLAYSSNRGASFATKEPGGSVEIIGICGGPYA